MLFPSIGGTAVMVIFSRIATNPSYARKKPISWSWCGIHLNPIRARIVEDMEALGRYPFSGHSAIMGRVRRDWQDIRGVLSLYDRRVAVARRLYWRYVEEGIVRGQRRDITGGGLIRSHGGWTAVKAMREARLFEKSDERILGDGDFVEEMLAVSREKMEQKYHLLAKGITLDRIALRLSDLMGVEPSWIWGAGKDRNRVNARSLLCYWAVRALGLSMAELSRRLNLSLSGVSQSVKRGENLVQGNGYRLVDE